MDMSELLRVGAAAFMDSDKSGTAGSSLDPEALTTAFSGLTGGKGGLDLSAILEAMQSGGMAEIAQSWLGDGQNAEISNSNLDELFGADKLSEFASQLGLSQEEAAGGLRDALPQIVDNASRGGSLLDSIGGIEGAIDMAGKLFGR